MPILTLEAIADDPWNAVNHELPPDADWEFLETVHAAVNYCVTSQHALMEAARDGRYTPSWWTMDEVCPDAHEEAEEYWLRALRRWEMIMERFERLGGFGLVDRLCQWVGLGRR